MNRRRVFPIILLLIVIGVGAWFLLRPRGDGGAFEGSGTVEATESELGFTVTGRIEQVAVVEGDTVVAGAELASLDRAELQARRDQAAATAVASEAALLELKRGSRPEEIRQAEAAAKSADEDLATAEREAARARELHSKQVFSDADLDKVESALGMAKARQVTTQEALKLAKEGPRKERIDAARANSAAAAATVRSLDATLANAVIRAPFAGVVTVRNHHPGEIVQAGAPVLTVLDRTDRWVKVYVPETRIGSVHVGQTAHITTDTFPGKKYSGKVSYVAPEAEFTPKTVQTREERVKLVYAVKVRIEGDPGGELKPGMPADVALENVR